MIRKLRIILILAMCIPLSLPGCGGAALPGAGAEPVIAAEEAETGSPSDGALAGPEEETAADPLYFDPDALCFGKKYSELAEAVPGLRYSTGFEDGWPGFCTDESIIIYKFAFYDLIDPDNPDPDAVVAGVKAPGSTIFPNLSSRIRSAEIEEILGVSLPDKKNQNLEYDGGVFEVFRMQGYVFLYWSTEGSLYSPDDSAEDIAPETHVDVVVEDVWDGFIHSGLPLYTR
ncbi:MAG: hypothetical protein FWG03_01560 [Clostridiales bacterium]|nr:hypothetical protein [Clostridiales bacterium]